MQHCQGDEVRLLGLGYFVAASTHYSASVCVPTQERGNEKAWEREMIALRVSLLEYRPLKCLNVLLLG